MPRSASMWTPDASCGSSWNAFAGSSCIAPCGGSGCRESCGTSIAVLTRRSHVHTPKFSPGPGDDDYQRDLLGSWANTYKGVRNYRFELFYWDYAVGIFLMSLLLALTLGSTGHDASSFLNNVQASDTSNILWTMVGGAIFNLANLLLVAAIDMAGLAVALPVSIGIALVVGTLLSYILQLKGSVLFLASGVACALLAVIFDGKAFGSLPGGRAASRKSIVVCIVSGILMGLWNPFVAY